MENAGNFVLHINDISKSYGVVQALQNVSFSIKEGEIHTILGENGAGKSTLVKIIMGEETPTSGAIELDGKPMEHYSPAFAKSCGIQMVHQELAIFENVTVAENIFPWHDFEGAKGFLDWKLLKSKARKQLDLFALNNIAPEQMIDTVTLAGQQMIEILRCISENPRILLLDEPTSGLNECDIEKLMNILGRLKDEGHTIIYISHKLKEIMEISDRITVLRDGQYVCTLDNEETLTEQTLISKMVGRDLSASLYSHKEYTNKSRNQTLFELRGLYKKDVLAETGFSLKKGELLGIFGLEGSGTDRLSKMLYGLEEFQKGEFVFKGKSVRHVNPTFMVENKILYLNNNRKNAGLFLDMGATDNISCPVLKEISGAGIINFNKLKDIAREYIEKFSVVIPSLSTKPKQLSGGNQQKIMLTICLAAKPDILIVNEPTRGIDVGAKADIHKLLLQIAGEGVGIVIFSSELPELMNLADRILVMRNQAIVGEFEGEQITEESIMTYAASEGVVCDE
jgi:ABC-type sugar transport system ATPase subunit